MDIILVYNLKKDATSTDYLHTHSYWYKYLNRDPNYFKNFKDEIKKEYKLTLEDRIGKVSETFDNISKIIDILN